MKVRIIKPKLDVIAAAIVDFFVLFILYLVTLFHFFKITKKSATIQTTAYRQHHRSQPYTV